MSLPTICPLCRRPFTTPDRSVCEKCVPLNEQEIKLRTRLKDLAEHHDKVLELLEAKAEQLMVDIRSFRRQE